MPVIRKSQVSSISASEQLKALISTTRTRVGQDAESVHGESKSPIERDSYRTANGKKVTEHQWDVYDLVLRIPRGKVSTYKQVRDKLGKGSPRSVGSALRKNPFAPFVPCHRVIASDLTLGGFYGEWGTAQIANSKCSQKIEILKNEGVIFDKTSGKLVDKQSALW